MLNITKIKLNNKTLNNINYSGSIENVIGTPKHFLPADKEWYNSVYTYNKNSTKLFPALDKKLLKLLKSYFFMYSRKLEIKIKSRRLRMRQRRLSTNRILISKAELKHTNDTIVITIYIYNRQKKFYLNKLNKLDKLNKTGKINLLKNNLIKINNKINITFNEMDKLVKYIKTNITGDFKHKSIFLKKVNLLKRKIYFLGLKKKNLIKKHNLKVSKVKGKSVKVLKKVLRQKLILCKTLNFDINKCFHKNYEKNYLKKFLKKCFKKEMLSIYIRQIILVNNLKFGKSYLTHLSNLIKSIYNKKIVFNLVNLKYFYLNSFIFSQAVLIRLRNKKNKAVKVLKTSLRSFKVPYINKLNLIREMPVKKLYKKSLKVNQVFSDNFLKLKNKDALDNALQVFINNDLYNKKSKQINNNVLHTKETTSKILDSVKNKLVTGVRIEAAGRLTKRNTAARSIYKVRYKGNMKNTDSSYRGLPTVMLRGHEKSSIQYTRLKSKIRIGAFGLKGWVNTG